MDAIAKAHAILKDDAIKRTRAPKVAKPYVVFVKDRPPADASEKAYRLLLSLSDMERQELFDRFRKPADSLPTFTVIERDEQRRVLRFKADGKTFVVTARFADGSIESFRMEGA